MHNHSNGNELRIVMQIKLISLTIVEHQDSLRNRNKHQLGNGPLFQISEIAQTSRKSVIRGLPGSEPGIHWYIGVYKGIHGFTGLII